MKNVLITGHRGYLGSELVKEFSNLNNINILGFDKLLYLGNPKKNKSKDFRDINFSKLNTVEDVIHLAGISTNYDPPEKIYHDLAIKINYEEAVNLAVKAKKAGVKRFIFASSASIYGESSRDYVDENCLPNPLTAYATSKLKAENELLKLKSKKFSPIILRMVTLFGLSERMRLDVLINNLILSSLVNRKIILRSDGSAIRPQVHVKDVCKIYKTIVHDERDDLNGMIINIGRNDYNYNVLDMANILGTMLNSNVIVGKEKTLDNRSYTVDFSKQEKLFPNMIFNNDLKLACNQISKYYFAKKNNGEWYNNNIYYNLKRMKFLIDKNKINQDYRFLINT